MPNHEHSRPSRAGAAGLINVLKSEGAFKIIQQLVAVGWLLLVAALFLFIALNWSYFSKWLLTVQHAEGPFGLKFDRYQTAENIKSLFNPGNGVSREGNPDFVLAAVRHAALLGNAIQGAKILWVDSHPDNNRYERRILRDDMGVSVQLAWSTDEALRFLAVQGESPDLVISNVVRSEKSTTSLSACRGVYYDFPDEHLGTEHANDIWKFNASVQTTPSAGFAMAELMAKAYPGQFGDHQRPRIIFYTAASGGIAADACARIITNRPDVLLENVVSALAGFRSEWLPDPQAPPSKTAATPQQR